MFKNWSFKLHQFFRKLSVRAAMFGLLGLLSSLAGVYFYWVIPQRFANLLGGEAAKMILNMLSSSMLIVVTFALSTMVMAYSAANQSATPRATRLIIQDSRSISAISVFLGAFVYSIVSLIALSTDLYGEKGRVFLLSTTIVVIGAVIWMIVQWVGELKNMGRVQEAIRRVYDATTKSLKVRAQLPTLGCRQLQDIPSKSKGIDACMIGYIQNIDLESLSEIADEHDLQFYIQHDVGSFIHHTSTLLLYKGNEDLSDEIQQKIRNDFSVGNERTFDNDPRYGITTLSGIGIKALSPSLNDPGTAIDVIGYLTMVIICWKNECSSESQEIKYKNLYFHKLYVSDFFNDAFYSIAKEGSSNVAVALALKEAYLVLGEVGDKDLTSAAHQHTEILYQRVEDQLDFRLDIERVHQDRSPRETNYTH